MTELKTIEEKVKLILNLNWQARSSDNLLICLYLREYHNIVTFMELHESTTAPSLESIRRTRQKIQAAGLFLATGGVEQGRNGNIVNYEEYARGVV